MTLEDTILELTSQTASGGEFKIGEASVRVWFCSDIWEWEYLGETFWDLQDLADALVQGSPVTLPRAHSQSRGTKNRGRLFKRGAPGVVASQDWPRSAWEIIPDRRSKRRSPVRPQSRKSLCSRVARGGLVWSPCGPPCPGVTPCKSHTAFTSSDIKSLVCLCRPSLTPRTSVPVSRNSEI